MGDPGDQGDRGLLHHLLVVPLSLRPAPTLHLPGHPQHPALLCHEESWAEEAQADDQQDEAGEEGEGGAEEHDGQVEKWFSV